MIGSYLAFRSMIVETKVHGYLIFIISAVFILQMLGNTAEPITITAISLISTTTYLMALIVYKLPTIQKEASQVKQTQP